MNIPIRLKAEWRKSSAGEKIHLTINGVALCSPQGQEQPEGWPLGVETKAKKTKDFTGDDGCPNCRKRLDTGFEH